MKRATVSANTPATLRQASSVERDEIAVVDRTIDQSRPRKGRYISIPDVDADTTTTSGGGGGGGSSGSSTTTDGAVRVRKNQCELTSVEWDRLVEAMKCLKKDKGSRNWDYFTDLHAKYGNHDGNHDLPHHDGDDLTIHSPIYWLPWHRKFILEFEERLRDFDSSIEIPYWDWTRFREIPKSFRAKVGGWMHVSRAVFHNGDKLPTVAELNRAKSASDFTTFDNVMLDLHASVHNWVGGDMANPAKSPDDPLFFLHHGFIDKVWADWQASHDPSLFPSDYLGMAMPPWADKVEDVISTSILGYEFG